MKKKGLLKVIIGVSLVAVLAVALPLMGGCVPAPPEVAPPEVAPPEVEPILVGACMPFTGPYASDGYSYWTGFKLAVEELNAAGGVLGRPLEISKFDTYDLAPERLEDAANTFAAEGAVMADGGWSGSGGDVRAFGKYDFIYFTGDASEGTKAVMLEDPETYSNFFLFFDTEKAYGSEYFDAMASLEPDFGYEYPNRDVAIIYADDDWGRECMIGFSEAMEREGGGWNVVMKEVVPYGTEEWGPILTKFRALDPVPGMIYVEIVSAPEQITLFRQFVENPTNTLLNFGYSASVPEYLEVMGAESDGLMASLGSSVGMPPQTEATKEWVDRFEQKWGHPPRSASPANYMAVMMWAEAVEAVGDVTDYAAIEEFLATQTFEVAGLPYQFAGADSDRIAELPFSAWTQGQIQNGDWCTLYWQYERYTDYQGKEYEFIVPWWIE